MVKRKVEKTAQKAGIKEEKKLENYSGLKTLNI